MKVFINLLCILCVVIIGAGVVSAQNYKIRQTTSINGQEIASSVFVKGSRKRTESSGMMGMGADVATIEQCDLNRSVMVSDKKRMYYLQPYAAAAPSAPASVKAPAAPAKMTKGGTITQTSSINDTGERKQMFGLTARHIKTVMTMTSSPDACDKQNMRIETDGWYVDLPMFSCPVTAPRSPMAHPVRSGCQDTIIVKQTGGGKLGFALELTQTFKSGDDDEGFSQTISTVEFSKATLDDALFNVPTDYRLAGSSQELYGQPDYSAMMASQAESASDNGAASGSAISNTRGRPSGKKPGTIRIGVLAPTNRSSESISAANLQSYLVQQLTSGKAEGIAVSSEAEARAAGCDYLLTSDFSKMKQSTAGKIGGIFGKVTNTGVGGAYDAQVDYKLVSLADGRNALQNKAANKTETDAERAAESVLAIEAQAVLAAAK